MSEAPDTVGWKCPLCGNVATGFDSECEHQRFLLWYPLPVWAG